MSESNGISEMSSQYFINDRELIFVGKVKDGGDFLIIF